MLFLHLLFPKGNGIIDPAFGAGSSPKSKAVPQTGIHMKLRIDPGLLHGFESRLHDPPVGDAVPVTDTGIGGRITFGILAQSRVLHDDRTGTGQIAAAKGFCTVRPKPRRHSRSCRAAP